MKTWRLDSARTFAAFATVICLAAVALLTCSVLLAAPAETWQTPVGTRTDCGLNYSSYVIRTETACADTDTECWKLRYGPMFGRSSNRGQCLETESERAIVACFEELFGRAPSKQDRLDLTLSNQPWLAGQLNRRCCVNCTASTALPVLKDGDKISFRGNNCAGFGENRRADNLPCGLVIGYNCAWQRNEYWLNKAPHCLGAAPDPEPDPDPPVRPPGAGWRCRVSADVVVNGTNSTGRLENAVITCSEIKP